MAVLCVQGDSMMLCFVPVSFFLSADITNVSSRAMILCFYPSDVCIIVHLSGIILDLLLCETGIGTS